MRIVTISLCFVFSMVFFDKVLIAQDNNKVKDQYLIWLEEKEIYEEVFLKKITPFAYKRLSKSLPIYLVELEGQEAKELANNPDIKYIQANHYLELRNRPNDSLYLGRQQTLELIQAPLAWRKSTGGTTFRGDRIVVGVIDNFFDIYHEDLQDNFWRNIHEIPNNGIDEDLNGYIDDYLGLNISSGYDNIYSTSSQHGTAVAGIIGSKGDNQIGVTGVNWDIDLLGVGVSSQNIVEEHKIIEAFDYLLNLRKRFNASNGAEGAFISVINCSWGIDYARAEDFPIWCAFYDALGEEGILSIAATSNQKYNVDQLGDMPSSCLSEALIIVHESTVNDELYRHTAYGESMVDIAAPGLGTYTTYPGDLYRSFSGTSAAAPYVSGAIGLLYSMPLQSWTDYYYANPAAAAKLLKRTILQSSFKNSNFIGRNKSGGRLDLGMASDLLYSFFDSTKNTRPIKLYPNPCSNYVSIELFMEKGAIEHIHIYSSLGQLLLVHDYVAEYTGVHFLEISTAQLTHGLYFIHRENSKEKNSLKFIKSLRE